jgi:hypothetical protein
MPFKSEKQRRFLWAAHPDIAKKWADKYPESNKNLPMYAAQDKNDKKAADLGILTQIIKNADKATVTVNSILTPDTPENAKTADSKQEQVDIPRSSKPVYAGEEREKGMISSSIDTGKNVNESCGKNAINELLQKLSVVLSPAIEQTIENMNAENEGRVPVRVGKTRGVKQYPAATPQIPLPMGMQQAQVPQQAQTQQSQPTSPTPVGAGQSSATTDPIKFHSGLSASGIINGNAALSAPNTVNTKISAAVLKWAYDIGNRRQSTNVEDLRTQPQTRTWKQWAFEPLGSPSTYHPPTHTMPENQEKYRTELMDNGLTRHHPAYAPNNRHTKAVEQSVINTKVPAQSSAEYVNNIERRDENILSEWQGNQPVNYDGRPIDVRTRRPSGLPLSPQQEKTPVPQSAITTETQGAFKRYAPERNKKSRVKKSADTPAWQRAAGKNDEGGLNAKGRASYNRATGGNLKAPVTESNPKGERNKRQNSFCSRMCGMKKHETGSKTKSDPDSRINKSLRKWNCKCGSEKQAQEFDPVLSDDATNSIMHGAGLVGSGAVGTALGVPLAWAINSWANKKNLIPSEDKNYFGHNLANSLTRVPMLLGGMLGMGAYDNYILRPHMRRELERKKQEEAVRQQLLNKQAGVSLGRVLGTLAASTGGGLLLGGYPGWKLERASQSAGNHDFVNFLAGKTPIAMAGASSAALFNHLYDKYEDSLPKKQKEQEIQVPKIVQYLVH